MSTTNVTKKENSNQVENKKTVDNTKTDSVAQILKNNTHEITKKLESQFLLKYNSSRNCIRHIYTA